MLNQTLDLTDLPRLLTLTFIELALSADNAIVLALLTRSLTLELRKKALLIGSLSAFFFRAVAIFAVGWLLHYPWLRTLGGLYLLYLSIDHFWKKRKHPLGINRAPPSFWKAVLLVELFDLAFAIDSILAGIAFIGPAPAAQSLHPKLWIVYAGGMMGLLGIRYAAHWFSELVDRFARLETSAFLLVGWIGLKLCYQGLLPWISYPIVKIPLFWPVLLLILGVGFLPKRKN